MQNVLLSEKQRTMMNYQKLKVLDDGSTSGSDDRFYEPSVKLRDTGTKDYKKRLHIGRLNKMLHGYLADGYRLDDTDMRLLVGIASKVPVEDLPGTKKGKDESRVDKDNSRVNLLEKVLLPSPRKQSAPRRPVKVSGGIVEQDRAETQGDVYDRTDVANISGMVNPVVGTVGKIKRDHRTLEHEETFKKVTEYKKNDSPRKASHRTPKGRDEPARLSERKGIDRSENRSSSPR